MKMLFVALAMIFALLTLGGCEPDTGCPPVVAKTDTPYGDDFTRQWYEDVMSGLGQVDIEQSIKDAQAVAEYRVLANYALLGYNYFALQVFKDGTGRFIYMVYQGEYFDDGELLLNESIKIDEADVQSLKSSICENDFWDIPTEHPDEELGCDGRTFFAEGCENGSRHFIHMWEPEEPYGIYKIYKAFDEYSETVSDNPLADYQKEY